MSALSTSFNEDQMAEFQEAFLLFDNHGDGRIPVRPNTKHIPW
jgi:Ca2+-binding EF-hand superfamily protein